MVAVQPELPSATVSPLAQSHPMSAGNRLPVTLTGFLGRERELSTIADLVRDPMVRLVTLTGPGGVGKTRLAIRVAEQLTASFPDGVWFTPLAAVRQPSLVLSAIAQSLAVRESSQRSTKEGIAAILHDQDALLVLDHFEHLLDEAQVVPELLIACPRLTCLVTSRTVLHVSGEHVFPVPPLPLPPETSSTTAERAMESSAVRLFVARAQAARPDFVLTDSAAGEVTTICRRLDGLPLAIELAAARMRHQTPIELASRLESDTRGGLLRMLTGGPRDAPDRQQTLRYAMAWSHDLLEPDQRIVFRRIGVFVGGFSLEAAEAVANPEDDARLDVPAVIAALVDQSLIERVEDPHGISRFRLLETIREFALEQLMSSSDEETMVRDAHAAYFLSLAERAAPELLRSMQRAWLSRLESEHGNFVAALNRLSDRDENDALLRLSTELLFYWWMSGHLAEGLGWLEQALAKPVETAHPLRAKALFGAGLLANNLGDLNRGERFAQLAREQACAARQPIFEAMALILFSYAALAHGRAHDAAEAGESAVALMRSTGDQLFLSLALGDAGLYLAASGHVERGAAYIEEALLLDRKRGDDFLAGVRLSDLGLIAHDGGDPAKASECYAESMVLLSRAGGSWYMASPCAGQAALIVAQDPARAARLLGAAEALRERSGLAGWATEQQRDEDATMTARAILGNEEFARQFHRGRGLSVPDIVAEAVVTDDNNAQLAEPLLADLTAREMEVLRLLIAGNSDRDIADALFISHRTASKHVSNILAKLDVGSRSEAAILAVRHGLV